jgi:hypothetical protein
MDRMHAVREVMRKEAVKSGSPTQFSMHVVPFVTMP